MLFRLILNNIYLAYNYYAMHEIDPIYSNSYGVAFYWKIQTDSPQKKIQLIFRNTGFYLTVNEIKKFVNYVNVAYNQKQCSNCEDKENCTSILLRTPSEKVNIMVNRKELKLILDLLEGILFKNSLESYLKSISIN